MVMEWSHRGSKTGVSYPSSLITIEQAYRCILEGSQQLVSFFVSRLDWKVSVLWQTGGPLGWCIRY